MPRSGGAFYFEKLKLRARSLFNVEGVVAPFFGGDILDSFCEVPAVAVKVLNVILALAVGMLCGLCQDHGAILTRSLAMAFCIFDADLNALRMVGDHIAFGDGEAAVPGLHLDAVIGDA